MPELLTFVDEAAVMKVLGQEVPDLHVQSIAFHHAYQDRCVVEINDSLILKFPLREQTRGWMAREHWVLNALQGRISIATPTPVFVAQQVFCYSYQKVPGILLTDEHYWTLTTRQKQHLALAIAHFLSELHGLLDVVEAAAAGLRPPDDPLSSWQLRQRLLPLLEQSQYVSLVEQILDRYQQIESIWEHEVVLHGDLHGWNIALDPATNQLVGVFDFNGTCIGDLGLTTFRGGDKLGRESPTGGQHAKGTADLYQGIQTGSGAISPAEWQTPVAGRARVGYCR